MSQLPVITSSNEGSSNVSLVNELYGDEMNKTQTKDKDQEKAFLTTDVLQKLKERGRIKDVAIVSTHDGMEWIVRIKFKIISPGDNSPVIWFEHEATSEESWQDAILQLLRSCQPFILTL